MEIDDPLAEPLLGRHLGSNETEFKVFERQDDSGPNGLFRRGIPLHSHRTEDEAWYVLRGRLRFQYGEREFDAREGSAVLLRHGTPHTFWNPGPEPVRYLMIVRPKTAELLEVLHAPGRPEPVDLRALYASFDVDLLE